MTKRKARSPSWNTVSFLTLNARRADGRLLTVLVSTSPFLVLGFESPEPKPGISPADALTSIFDNHAHKVIGEAESLSLNALSLLNDTLSRGCLRRRMLPSANVERLHETLGNHHW